MTGFVAELRKRNVLRVGAAYLVVGWLVLQFVDVVFPMFGLDEALGRPILMIMLVGLPVTLILSWVFELTPEGIKKESDVDRSESITTETGRMLDRSIIVHFKPLGREWRTIEMEGGHNGEHLPQSGR